MTPDTCGPGHLVLFDTFAHVSSSWRTSGDTSRSVSIESSRTLPKRGSMLNGALYEHPTWEPPTVESDCSLLLTPTATDGKGRKTPRPDREKGVGRLEEQLQLLPTPTANQPGGTAEQMLARKAKMPGGARTTVTDLRMVLELLPTPTRRDGNGWRDARNREGAQSLPHRLMDLHGRSTPRQSVDGNASSDAPPPTPSPTRAS